MNYELCAQYLPLEGELKREDLNDSKFTFDNPPGSFQILPIEPPKGHSMTPKSYGLGVVGYKSIIKLPANSKFQ